MNYERDDPAPALPAPKPLATGIEVYQNRFSALVMRVRAERERFVAGGGICWDCRDLGWLANSEEGQPSVAACPLCPEGALWAERQAHREQDILLAQTGATDFKYALQTWPGNPDILHRIEVWDDDFVEDQPFLLLWGVTGSGKSNLAAALLRRAIRRGHMRGRFVNAVEMIEELRQQYNGQPSRLAPAARNEPLVVLDDLGITNSTEYALEQLYLIVNARYNRRAWPVFTTNLDPRDQSDQGLRARIGDRVYYRIIERALVVRCGNKNFRVE